MGKTRVDNPEASPHAPRRAHEARRNAGGGANVVKVFDHLVGVLLLLVKLYFIDFYRMICRNET